MWSSVSYPNAHGSDASCPNLSCTNPHRHTLHNLQRILYASSQLETEDEQQPLFQRLLLPGLSPDTTPYQVPIDHAHPPAPGRDVKANHSVNGYPGSPLQPSPRLAVASKPLGVNLPAPAGKDGNVMMATGGVHSPGNTMVVDQRRVSKQRVARDLSFGL